MLNEKKSLATNTPLLLAAVIALVLIALYAIARAPVTLDDTSLRVGGIYGVVVDYARIEKIELSDNFDEVGVKTNAFELAYVEIGNYTFKDVGAALVYRTSTDPHALIIRTSAKTIVIQKGAAENRRIFDALVAKTRRSP